MYVPEVIVLQVLDRRSLPLAPRPQEAVGAHPVMISTQKCGPLDTAEDSSDHISESSCSLEGRRMMPEENSCESLCCFSRDKPWGEHPASSENMSVASPVLRLSVSASASAMPSSSPMAAPAALHGCDSTPGQPLSAVTCRDPPATCPLPLGEGPRCCAPSTGPDPAAAHRKEPRLLRSDLAV